MLEYEYSAVTVERICDADSDEPRVYASLQLEPHDEKILLTYKGFGFEKLTISFEFYIEDWKDVFQRIVEERIHANRTGSSSDPIFPKDLKITGKRNPLVNMIILAFCCPQSAQLCLRLIDCSQEQLEQLLIKNKNFEASCSVKFANIVCELLDKAFLRVKYLVGFDGIRLSEIMKTARQTIAVNCESASKIQKFIDSGQNKVVFKQGPFLVVEVYNQDEFENIYEPAQYAVVYLDEIYDFGSEKIQASAVGNKRANDYLFSLTCSHVDWTFSCKTISEAPQATFDAIESYSDMVS